MNEADTRRTLIDQSLRKAGWNLTDPSQVSLEFDIIVEPVLASRVAETAPTYGGHQFADYLLKGKDGRALAVVEAKRTSKDPRLGKEQALQYARNIQKQLGGDVPLVFYTNGHEHHFWDSDHYPPRRVYGFPSRADMERMRFLATERRPLSVEMIDTRIAGRPYQIEAIRSVLEGVEAKRRKFLLIMATGTGKTRTCAGLVDVMTRANWAQRVLFLVDRIALRDQALDAFKEHLPNMPIWPTRDDTEFKTDRRAYVATYPTMLNVIQSESPYVSPHFFDLIVADESHRSIYNIYKQVLDYFDAIQLGLTATPTDSVDHDTFRLFDCESGLPNYAYTYEEAVNNHPPYLCDFEVLKVRSKFQLEGIKGGTLSGPEQKKLVAEGRDPDEIDFEGTDLERQVTNAGTNRLIVKEFMEESIKDPNGTLPGKSIFFAISKDHARRLEDLFNALYPEYKGELAKVIISEDPRVHGKGGLLDQFKNQDLPRVAISVDMLDTGVDVREIVNLVFAKPVYSYTKFWQMIGRGTRVLEDELAKRKPWCTDKDRFLIIDCWGNFDFFKMNPGGREPGDQVALAVRLFKARLDKLEAALAANRPEVVEGTKAALQTDLATLPRNNVVVLEHAADLARVEGDAFWGYLDATAIGYLRSKIAPILRARSGEDFKSLRFETSVVELSTAVLAGNAEAIEAGKAVVLEQVSELPLTVNIVAREKAQIDQVLQGSFWTAPSDEQLMGMAAKLGPLMKYRQRRTDPMMTLDLGDLVAIKEIVEFGPENERVSTKAYRERVEAHVLELVNENPVLQKIRAGQDVADDEIRALAELLRIQDPFVTEELLRKVYDHKTARFIQFIRHILGLEKLASWPETVSSAFASFIAEHNTFTALQVSFLTTLKTFILQTGKLEKRDLVNAPFTQLHPDGIRGVFQAGDISQILEFVTKLTA